MKRSKLTLRCPSCRTRMNLNEVSYIMQFEEKEKEKESIPVKEVMVRKIEGVVPNSSPIKAAKCRWKIPKTLMIQ